MIHGSKESICLQDEQSGRLNLLYNCLSRILFVSGLALAARQHQHLQLEARRQLGARIRYTENTG